MLSLSFMWLDEAKSAARSLGVDLRSMREPLKRAVKNVMLPSFHQNFDSEGRPSWTPAARGYGHSLLHDSGRLENGATVLANWDFDRERAQLNPASLVSRIGVKIIHQTGFSRNTKKGVHTIPARPFIMMQADDEEKIEQIFDDWLNERVTSRWD